MIRWQFYIDFNSKSNTIVIWLRCVVVLTEWTHYRLDSSMVKVTSCFRSFYLRLTARGHSRIKGSLSNALTLHFLASTKFPGPSDIVITLPPMNSPATLASVVTDIHNLLATTVTNHAVHLQADQPRIQSRKLLHHEQQRSLQQETAEALAGGHAKIASFKELLLVKLACLQDILADLQLGGGCVIVLRGLHHELPY